MSRSGYTEDGECDNPATLLWPSVVRRSLKGKRGQKFFRDLAVELDAMPVKRLIEGELVTREGECCAMGVVCKARGIDVSNVDPHESEEVGRVLDIAHQLAADIAYHNDEDGPNNETPEERWVRMRKWVDANLREPAP